jgi:hypothetical protein
MIPFIDLAAQQARIRDKIEAGLPKLPAPNTASAARPERTR